MTNNGVPVEEYAEKKEWAIFLNSKEPYKRPMMFEDLGVGKGLPPPSELQASKLELKPLPKCLMYEFLGKHDTLPVIISVNLDQE